MSLSRALSGPLSGALSGPLTIEGVGFTPLSLSPTVWYDPSDLSTMFQDSAGTTPVTADGDPVGRINDKSGNGHHATQTTSAKRPTYKTSGGLHWLAFDGVDDVLTTGNVNFTGTDKATVFTGLSKASNPAGRGTIVNLKDNGFNSFTLEVPRDSTINTRWIHAGNTTLRNAQIALSLNTPVIYTGLSDLGAPSISLRTNGVVGTADTGTTGGGNFTVGPLSIGDYNPSSTGRYFHGSLYGLIIRPALSSAGEIASTETYMAAKSGVTL